MSRLRHQVVEDATPVQQIYENEISAMTPANDTNVSSLASVKTGLDCHRRNDLSLNPQTRQDVDLEGIWTETTDGWRFMCVDDGEKENILIFASDEMVDKMQKFEKLFMDGTFYVYPSLWCQFYSIHCLVDDVRCPVAYTILPWKSMETYVRLFTLINAAAHTRIGTEPAPRVIQTDFEVAAVQAAQEVYPGADIRAFFCFSFLISCGVMSHRKALQLSTGPTLISSAMFVERCLATTPTQPSAGRLDGCPEQQSRPSKARGVQRLHHRDMGGRWRQISASTLELVGWCGTSDQQQHWRVPQQAEEPDPKRRDSRPWKNSSREDGSIGNWMNVLSVSNMT